MDVLILGGHGQVFAPAKPAFPTSMWVMATSSIRMGSTAIIQSALGQDARDSLVINSSVMNYQQQPALYKTTQPDQDINQVFIICYNTPIFRRV